MPGGPAFSSAAFSEAFAPGGEVSGGGGTFSGAFSGAFASGGGAGAPAPISSTTPEFDYVAHAIAHLPHMYRSSDPARPTNTEKALRARLGPANTLGAAMRAVLTQRTVDNAIGAQLDVLGALVGRPRQGVVDDEVYRRYIRAQILTNKSDGVVRDILAVARAVIGVGGTIVNRNTGTAAFVLSVEGIALADTVAAVLVELVLRATSDGVLAVVVWSADPSTVGHWGAGTWGTSTWGRSRDKEF